MEPRTTVSHGLDLTPDLLATQGRALRGLASSLLGDAHAAEDVVQETWIACLKHPGALPERVSAWLGTVTKHLALHRRRGDDRRVLRERAAAAPERLEALQQRTLEREEALRAVTQALLALEEPYKTALFLRFFEERSPSAIAAELELPLPTVKSRIARGLEQLRAKLTPAFGGDELRRKRALRALAGFPAGGFVHPRAPGSSGAPGASGAPGSSPALGTPGSSPALAPGAAASTIGALSLGAKLAAALALAGGAVWLWPEDPEQRSELARVPSATEPLVASLAAGLPATEPSSPPQTGGEDAAQREPVAATPGPADAGHLVALPAGDSFPYRITGQVRDELDFPLMGARVFLGPHRFALNRVATTDEEGRFTFEFDARRAALACAFTVDDGGGRMLGLQELELVSGRELVVDVGLGPISNRGSTLVELHQAEAARANLELVAAKRAALGSGDAELVAELASYESELVAFAARSVGPLERAPESQRRSDGRGIFVDPPPFLACERPVDFLLEETVAFGNLVEELRLFGGSGQVSVDLGLGRYAPFSRSAELLVVEEPPAAGTVRGVVRDAAGSRVAGAEVRWARPGGAFEERASTGTDGSFTLPEVPAGEVVLRAGGGDHGLALERLTITPGQELAWSPTLARGDEVTGRVCLFVAEMPLAGVLVELWSVSPERLWCDATLTGEDGRFSIPNVPAGALALHVYASGNMKPPSAFPIRTVSPVLARSDVGDLLLTKDEVVTGSLAVTVLGPDGEPLPGAEVRVWQHATGRGVFAGEPDEEGSLALAGLPAGAFRVEAGGAFGWRDLGLVWIDPWAEGVELGEVRFPPPGLVELAVEPASADADPVRATLWSATPDVFARADERELGRAVVALRAGDYMLSAAAGKDRRSETPLAIRTGAPSALALEVPPGLPPVVRPGAVAQALEAGARDTRCSSCHVSAPGGG